MATTSQDLFAHTLNTEAHEIAALVRHLAQQPRDKRLDAVKGLRKAVKRSHNVLPSVTQNDFFRLLSALLHDDPHQRPNVTAECLWLVVDVIPFQYNVDHFLAPILAPVVAFLGHESADVRRAALRLLSVHMKYTQNLQKCVKSVVEFGLESDQKEVRRGTVVALPLLFGEEFAHENLFPLADSLGRLLVQSDAALFYPVFLALQRLHSVVGNDSFDEYLRRMSEETQELYRSVLSRNPSADDHRRDHSLLEPMHSSKTVSFARADDSSSDQSFDPSLKYGFFAPKIIVKASSARTEDKVDAIQEVLALIRNAPLHQLAQLLPEMHAFLAHFLSPQLNEQNNFKVTLSALDVIESLVERLKTSMNPFLDALVAILAKRLGDARTVIRDSVIRSFHQLMYTFAPQDILDLLLLQKPSKNPKVREEVINRVTAAVLTFPRSEFNLPKLCFAVSPLLADSRRAVRLAALECLSVLAQALGPHRLAPLMAAVEAIEQSVQMEGLVGALQARLARRQLPRCAADGTVRYVLNPQNFSGWFTAGSDADLEWVMLATPSSTATTPPKALPVGRNGVPSGIPLATIPFDRRRSNGASALPPEDHFSEEEEEDVVEAIGRRKSLAEVNIDKLLTSGQTSEGRSPQMTERPFLSFRGESFQSDVESNDWRRESGDDSLDVWRQYFSEFRAQLAEVAIFGGNEKKRRNSELPLPLPPQPVFAQEVDGFRGQSPVQSSSAPSTASADIHFFAPDVNALIENRFEPIERSLSLPSIGPQVENEMQIQEPIEESNNDGMDFQELREEAPPAITSTPFNTPTVAESTPPPQGAQEDPHDGGGAQQEAPPLLSVQEATPQHTRRQTPEQPLDRRQTASVERLDVWTQKDETLSSETTGSEENQKPSSMATKRSPTKTPRRKRAQPVGRLSRSQSPQSRRRPSRAPQHLYIKTTPAIPANANIRLILANVARTEGPFESPHEASRAALLALQDDAWTTKVEGMLAVTRLATFHGPALHKEQHALVTALLAETRNLRSTVARAAIFALGELFARLRHQVEPEMDAMVAALLAKSADNAVFIREDVERALLHAVEQMPQTRTAIALIVGGASHRNALVRRTSAQFVALLVERMGATKCLLGPRDIGEHVLPAAARFVQDSSAATRYYGRRVFAQLLTHSAFEKLLRKHVTPGTYRNICGILESIKRRGVGDRPQDLSSPLKDLTTVSLDDK